MKPETARRTLVWMLRGMGVMALFAIVAVIMPHAWMEWCHQLVGLGDLDDTPMTRYLSRSLSAFYVFFGAMILQISTDLDRYRDLVRFSARCGLGLALAEAIIDITSGLPWWWTVSEAGFGLVFFSAVLVLIRKIEV